MPEPKYFIAVILLALELFRASAAEARQNCRLPSEIDALIVGMRLTLPTSGDLSSLQRARLSGLSASINKAELGKALRKAGIGSSQNAIADLIDNAQQIAADGFIADQAATLEQITRALNLVRSLCSERTKRIDQQLQRAGKLRQIDGQTSSLRGRMSLPDTSNAGSLVGLSLLAPLVIGSIAFIVFGHRLYSWIRAFTFSRKACKITAAVEHDLDIIDGHILIIGRRGVKFRPVNEGAFHRLEELGEGEPMNLLVGHHSLPGSIDALKDDFAAFFFDEPIHKDFIQILLRFSAITPRYERTPPPRRKSKFRAPLAT